MKHLKRFKTFVNESFDSEVCNPMVDEILAVQNSIDPTKCEFHTFTKDELCEMNEEELHGVMADVEAAKASCETVEEMEEVIGFDEEEGDEDPNFNYSGNDEEEGDFSNDDEGQERRVMKFDEWDNDEDDEDAYTHANDDEDFDDEDFDDEDFTNDDIDEFEEEISDEEDKEHKGGYDPNLPSEMW